MRVNRRTALRGGAVAAASTVLLTRPAFAAGAVPKAAVSPVPPATAPIVAAYRQLQTGINHVTPERAEALANLGRVAKAYNASMSVVGGGPLWTDLPLGPGSEFTTSMYARLRAIAVDWGTPGASLAGDPVVLERIKAALELIYASQYNENVGEIGNWYTYEIGIPYYLLHTLSVVADQLTPDQLARYLKPVKRFVGDPNRRANNASIVETGANRADKARDYGTGHGTPYNYDQHVPVLLMGWGIEHGEYFGAITPADIAPTLASLCGISLASRDGRVLAEALKTPGTPKASAPAR